jgi:hypothetical protein
VTEHKITVARIEKPSNYCGGHGSAIGSHARSLAALTGAGLMDRGVARKVMTTSSKARNDADAKFKIKAQRATEGAQAMADYIADGDAVRAKTARLKELRLAKEAAEKEAENKRVEKKRKPSRPASAAPNARRIS